MAELVRYIITMGMIIRTLQRDCNRHDLPPAVIDALTQHIFKNEGSKEKKEAQEKLQDS